MALDHSVDGRRTTYPHDPDWTNPNSEDYRAESKFIHDNYEKLVKQLEKECVPFSSYRYQGHMLWDQTLPSLAGYFAALLYNQNNVAAEASPLTTALEMEVADELCTMVGMVKGDNTEPWAHITCDGSVANIEAIWAARNTRLYPLAVYAALRRESDLGSLDGLEVRLTGQDQPYKRLVELDWWEMMNLTGDTIFASHPPDQNGRSADYEPGAAEAHRQLHGAVPGADGLCRTGGRGAGAGEPFAGQWPGSGSWALPRPTTRCPRPPRLSGSGVRRSIRCGLA